MQMAAGDQAIGGRNGGTVPGVGARTRPVRAWSTATSTGATRQADGKASAVAHEPWQRQPWLAPASWPWLSGTQQAWAAPPAAGDLPAWAACSPNVTIVACAAASCSRPSTEAGWASPPIASISHASTPKARRPRERTRRCMDAGIGGSVTTRSAPLNPGDGFKPSQNASGAPPCSFGQPLPGNSRLSLPEAIHRITALPRRRTRLDQGDAVHRRAGGRARQDDAGLARKGLRGPGPRSGPISRTLSIREVRAGPTPRRCGRSCALHAACPCAYAIT